MAILLGKIKLVRLNGQPAVVPKSSTREQIAEWFEDREGIGVSDYGVLSLLAKPDGKKTFAEIIGSSELEPEDLPAFL
jgi:hypothetical protein